MPSTSPISTSEHIRDEAPGDEARIAEVTTAAFAAAEHSDGSEAAIIERLRRDGDLTLSLVVERDGCVVGHAAFSPVTIDGVECGWFGLGPVAVMPGFQRSGVGGALIRKGLARLRERNARGCVVLGDPDYYRRFGFTQEPALRFPGPPPAYFQCLAFADPVPHGVVSYAPAFLG